MKKPVCGFCKLDFDLHPLPHCDYTYIPVFEGIGRVIGYEMIDSPIRAIRNGTDQPTT